MNEQKLKRERAQGLSLMWKQHGLPLTLSGRLVVARQIRTRISSFASRMCYSPLLQLNCEKLAVNFFERLESRVVLVAGAILK